MNQIGRPLTDEEMELVKKITGFPHLKDAVDGTTDEEKKRFLKLSEIINKQNVSQVQYLMCTIFGTELMIRMLKKGMVQNEANA